MDFRKRFKIEPGTNLDLAKIDPDYSGKPSWKDSSKKLLKKHNKELRSLQYLLYAENKHSLLICLQALDAAGKDGTINHVLGNMNPQGTRVQPFKVPTQEEAAHDFLWRIHKHTPQRGSIAIFNRSHYEDVLVVRVHNLAPKSVWSKRYELINDFEQTLSENGTHIIKFFLHISPEEQLRRFKKRIDDPERHWKISEGDYSERKLWDDYTQAYQDAISATSTANAPWYVIPANHKWFRNLAISKIVAETLKSLDMKFPAPTVDLAAIKQKYHDAMNAIAK